MFDGVVFPAPKQSSYSVGECFRNGHFVHIPRLPAASADDDSDHTGFVRSLSTSAAQEPNFDPRRAADVGEDPTWGVGLLMWPPARRGEPPCTDTKQRLLIYGHPNAVDIGQMAYELTFYAAALDCLVLAYEFRGYGLCEGKPSEEACLVDLKSAIRWGVDVLGFPVDAMILMGRSIGTGPATQLAAAFGRVSTHQQKPGHEDDSSIDGDVEPGSLGGGVVGAGPAMLVLEAPFTSIRQCTGALARTLGLAVISDFAAGMVGERFKSIDAIGDVECPILIVHGDKDTIVPFDHGCQLNKRANDAYYARHPDRQAKDRSKDQPHCQLAALEGIGHNDIPAPATIRAMHHFRPDIVGPIRLPNISPHVQPHPDGLPEIPRAPLSGRLPERFTLGQFRLEAMAKAPKVVWPNPHGGVHSAENIPAYIAMASASLASAVRVAWIEYNRCLEVAGAVIAAPAAPAATTTALLCAMGLPSGQPSGEVDTVKPLTLAEFIDSCLALWGSPFAVYRCQQHPHQGDLDAAAKPVSSTLVWFGRTVRVAAGGAGVEPGDHGSSYFDHVWRCVDHTLRASRRLMMNAAASDGGLPPSSAPRPTQPMLPVLEPLVFCEPSSKFREILRRNIERTTTVALSHPARHDGEAIEAMAPGNNLSAPPTPSMVARDPADGQQPLSKVTAMTTKGHAALQLECERFVIAALDDGTIDQAASCLTHTAPVDTDATPSHPLQLWRDEVVSFSAAFSAASMPPCITRLTDPRAICAWHTHADALRRLVSTPAGLPVSFDMTYNGVTVVRRPDPIAATKHARDGDGRGTNGALTSQNDTSQARHDEETEAQRGLRLLREKRDRKSRASDSDCVVA